MNHLAHAVAQSSPSAGRAGPLVLAIIYQAMGFPVEMFPVLFAIGRTAGWLAQWEDGILATKDR